MRAVFGFRLQVEPLPSLRYDAFERYAHQCPKFGKGVKTKKPVVICNMTTGFLRFNKNFKAKVELGNKFAFFARK